MKTINVKVETVTEATGNKYYVVKVNDEPIETFHEKGLAIALVNKVELFIKENKGFSIRETIYELNINLEKVD